MASHYALPLPATKAGLYVMALPVLVPTFGDKHPASSGARVARARCSRPGASNIPLASLPGAQCGAGPTLKMLNLAFALGGDVMP